MNHYIEGTDIPIFFLYIVYFILAFNVLYSLGDVITTMQAYEDDRVKSGVPSIDLKHKMKMAIWRALGVILASCATLFLGAILYYYLLGPDNKFYLFH